MSGGRALSWEEQAPRGHGPTHPPAWRPGAGPFLLESPFLPEVLPSPPGRRGGAPDGLHRLFALTFPLRGGWMDQPGLQSLKF